MKIFKFIVATLASLFLWWSIPNPEFQEAATDLGEIAVEIVQNHDRKKVVPVSKNNSV
jgi:hypothetical protein